MPGRRTYQLLPAPPPPDEPPELEDELLLPDDEEEDDEDDELLAVTWMRGVVYFFLTSCRQCSHLVVAQPQPPALSVADLISCRPVS